MQEILERLKAKKTELGISDQQLADILDIPLAEVTQYLTGAATPNMLQLLKWKPRLEAYFAQLKSKE